MEKQSFFVTGIDPGLTAGCVCIVDIVSGKFIDAYPFSLQNKNTKKHRGIISINEIGPAVAKLVLEEAPHFFHSTRYSLIESQMKPKLRAVQSCFQALLYKKSSLSSPRSVRSYYNISITSKMIKNKKQAYKARKRLSIDTAKKYMFKEDLKKVRRIATNYWRPVQYKMSPSILKKKIEKTIEDIIEAYLLVMFPGNWKNFLELYKDIPKCIIERIHEKRVSARSLKRGPQYSGIKKKHVMNLKMKKERLRNLKKKEKNENNSDDLIVID